MQLSLAYDPEPGIIDMDAVDGRNTSDSVRRYLRVEGQHVHYTFRADDQSLPTCFDTPCQITVAVE